MPDYDFSLVDAAVIDSQYATQRLFRDVLTRLGLKTVATFGSVKEASVVLTSATPDLVLVDADGDEGEAFRFVRTLRNEPSTPNPYAGLIVTTWQPTPALLLRVTNSGADDLLVKPVSPKQVQDRIVSLIEGRKAFVVTADYTGPDRRKSPREGGLVPLVDAPNTLRLKASGQWNSCNPRQLIQQTNLRVNEQKRLRASIQAAFLVEFAVPGLRGEPPDRMAIDHIARVPAVMDDLLRRLADGGTGGDGAVGRLCRTLKQEVERVRSGAENGGLDWTVLSRVQGLARELMQAVDRSRPLEAMTEEVANAVSGYRHRLGQIAQAKAAEAARVAAGTAAAG
ncbi:response regulator [Azospirillum sp. A39]|uniref:response regulator n=1 Tax=Azospirillum sp. A39 TaxID=3462279 RepID=UPI0040456C53